MEIRKGVFVTGIYENLPLDKGERSLRRDPLLVPTIGDFLVFRYMPMLQALQDATRASVRFARRHRRAIVVGGVVGATAYAYHMMRTAVKKAEEEREVIIQQAGEEVRYRQCLARTRCECLAALENFLPALRKRLFLSVDVIGPVRELKALRGGGGGSRSGSGGSAAVEDGSAAAGDDLESRVIELWEKVKVTALTRLVVALYTFNALALMLHIQLHILGRLSFEESLQILRRCKNSPSSDNNPEILNLSSSGLPISQQAAAAGEARVEMEAGTTTTIPGVVTPTANVGDGVALSMQARHALLSSTYEHVLGEGMRVLVKDVERAVARCTSSWYAHTRQEVGFQDLVAVLRRVRREIEGPIGGTRHYSEAATGGGAGVNPSIGAGRDDFEGVPGARHSQLLRYIINPSDGINGVATSQLDGITEQDSTIAGSGCTASDGARPGAIGDNSSMENAQQGVDGVRDVLDETWDTAESPNFAAALQNCLDTTFGMVYEKIRQKAFSRGIGGRLQTPVMGNDGPRSADGASGSEGSRGGRVAAPATDQQTPVTVGVASGPEAVTATAGAGTGVTGVVGGGMAGRAGAVGEGEERSQVLATVISQAKLLVSDILEPSASENGYVQAVAALPTVRDLCFSVFCSNRASPALAQGQPQSLSSSDYERSR